MGVCKRHTMGSEFLTAVSEEGKRVLSLRPPSYHSTPLPAPSVEVAFKLTVYFKNCQERTLSVQHKEVTVT